MSSALNLVSLLGRSMKGPDVVAVLRGNNLDVIYRFDDVRDNDLYFVRAPHLGFELRFDHGYRLDVIVCHVTHYKGFWPIDPEIVGVPLHRTLDEAQRESAAAGLETSASTLGKSRVLGVQHRGFLAQYEYIDGALKTITLSHVG